MPEHLENERRANRQSLPPKLVPTGSVDRVLLVGGKSLTLFQSIGVLVFAVLSLGIGVPMLRIGGVWFDLWGFAMSLWGLVMLFNGCKGIIRAILRK
jgi:hypothetical protein